MERESNSVQSLCRSGCGFYGNPATEGLCSVCYKKKQQSPTPSATLNSSSSSSDTDTSVVSIASIAATQTTAIEPSGGEASGDGKGGQAAGQGSSPKQQQATEGKDTKKKKNLCATCRKKVGLTGFECRCGGLYCAVHRYSDKHDCTFNYRELGAQEIRRNNMVVISEKVPKI